MRTFVHGKAGIKVTYPHARDITIRFELWGVIETVVMWFGTHAVMFTTSFSFKVDFLAGFRADEFRDVGKAERGIFMLEKFSASRMS